MRTFKKFLALFLVLTLVFQMAPLSAFAEGPNSAERSNTESAESVTDQASKETDSNAASKQPGTTVIGEVTSLRGQSEKHFRMDDGSFIAVDYGMPVHFSEDNGATWLDIDNTLVLNQTTETGRKQTGNVSSYKAVNGENAHSFAADLRSGFLFSAQSGSHGLFFSLADSAARPAAQGINEANVSDEAGNTQTEDTVAATKAPEAETAETESIVEAAKTVETETAATEAETDEAEAIVEAAKTVETETAAEEVERVEAEAPAEEAPETESAETETPETEAPVAETEPAETEAAVEVEEEVFSSDAAAEISYPCDTDSSEGKKSASGKSRDAAKETPSIAEQVQLKKLQADVLYRNVFQGVDLRYELFGYNVKETIVVNKPRDSYSFSFYMNLTDLKPELMQNGSVELRNEKGELIYLIPAPYMVDAKGAESTDASYTLEQTASGAWKLTVAASEKWINDEERAFPVEIDPTVYLESENYHIITSYVDSNKPNSAAFYNSGYLRSGYYTGDSNCKGHTVGLIYFKNLPKIPEHCVVTDARFSLYQIQEYRGSSFIQRLYATTISAPNNPENYMQTMTWNKYVSDVSGKYAKLGGANNGDTSSVLDYHVENKHLWKESTYVITSAAQRWYDPNDDSISRLLVLDDGHSSTEQNRATYGGCGSSGYTPIIYVTYRNTVGIEGIYGYHTQSIGRAGTGYVNNFTLQPSLSVPVLSAPSGTLPFGISLYYNGALSYSHFSLENPSNPWSDNNNNGKNVKNVKNVNNKCLTKLEFPDGKTATYSYYDDPEKVLIIDGKPYYRISEACDNETNYKIQYTYRGNKPLQVATVTESVKDGSTWKKGQRVNCNQTDVNHASFRYFDASNLNGGNYDSTGKLVTQHYFDSWGRTVNIVTMDPATDEVLGVSTGEYTQNEPGNAKNNRLTNSASAGIEAINLLQNADMEDGTSLYGWEKVGSGAAATAGNTEAGMKAKPYLGNKLMRIYESSASVGKCTVRQPVYLEINKTYVFSAYVNTADASNLGANGGAYLTILQNKNNTVIEKATSRIVNYTTSTAVDGGWERLEIAFTPGETGKYYVAANVNNFSKHVVFDNFQLEKTISFGGPDAESAGGMAGTASNFNLIQAASFEYPNPSTGAGQEADVSRWWSYDSGKAYPVASYAHSGDFGLTFTPNMSGKQRATQTVQINGSSNKTYILSGWGRTPQTNNTDCNREEDQNKLEEDNKNNARFFGLIAKVSYAESDVEPDYHYVSFNSDIGDWQFASGVVVPKQRDKTVSTITVSACLDYCANRSYMDEITLIQEPVQTYDYDDKGNLKSTSNSESNTSETFDSKDRLTGYTAMNGVQYTLTYSGDSRDPSTIVSDGITTSYAYDAAGNVTQTKTQAPNNGKYIQSDTTYADSDADPQDKTFDFPYWTTDSNGNDSYTTYDNKTGLLLNSINPNGIQTFNIYNPDNNQITSSYISFVAGLIRSYDSENGMLTQLTRKTYHGSQVGWQAYSFDYDAWGNTTGICVWKPSDDDDTDYSQSNVPLASYTYDSTGKMTRMNYPSGQYVTYEYDALDRLVSEQYYKKDNTLFVEYQYIYNANGQLAKQQAIRNGAVTESYSFEYDSLGRLIRSREEGGSGIVQRTEHLYDTAGRLTKQNWKVGERNFTETYAYDTADGTMTSMQIGYDSGNPTWGFAYDNLTYSYDALNRLTRVLDTENSTPFYTRNYRYQDLSGQRTTSRLARFDYQTLNKHIIYGNSYAYDKNGNITQINEIITVGGNNITEKSRVLAKYVYDELNQLKRETRYTYNGTSTTPASTTVVEYDLDMAGNLYSVKENGTVKVAYTYGDGDWADKLTKITVNGTAKSISYSGDALNPSNWYNGTEYSNLTWTQGRRLSSIQKGSQTYEYEYDMSGVRSVKIADGLRHEYVTQNGHVVRDTVTDASTGAFQYTLDFTYDESGNPLTMRRYYNEAQTSYNTYHYVVNAQGDVVKLLHGSSNTVAEYSYDAYGNVLTKSGSLADVNPLRYRGYYCDTETGFYYLQSRYYDPAIRRFLNADSYASTGQGFLGINMFAYCGNNPVSRADPLGQSYIWPQLFEDMCFGFIHKAVQMHIIMENAEMEMERYVYNSKGEPCGRADIFDPFSGQVWEIKTEKTGADAAYAQVKKYCKKGNTINGNATSYGRVGRFESSFILSCGDYTYEVNYWTPRSGVILYRVDKTNSQGNDDYAVYVPKSQRSKENQCTIGGQTVYSGSTAASVNGTVAACGFAGALLFGVACFGGGGCGRCALDRIY
jgi:RHS repeat-associated protein